MKRLLAVAVTLLFISASVIPSTGTIVEKSSSVSFDGKTLYVGGSGPGNYTTIQGAIDDASNGDTVFVYDDSSPYNEFVWINKSINLIGEDRNTTVIDGWGTGYRVVVYITTDNVYLTGFTIFNCSELLEKGILISRASNIIIRGNIIENNWYGINEVSSPNNSILDNKISNTTFGIASAFASTTIKGNTILNHTFGVYMQDTSNIVEGNTISTSKTPYVTMTVGITSKYSFTTNVIKGNTIIDHLVGIHCYGSFSHVVHGNNITNNYIGIAISNSSKFEVNNNRIANSYWYGIEITASSKNNIVRNTIANSGIYGIILQRLPYPKYSVFNRIKENNYVENNCSAFFKDSLFNRWIKNYWDRPRLLPHPIFGKIKLGKISIPWMNFDLRPAKEPYDM